jgi:hypothetical protein
VGEKRRLSASVDALLLEAAERAVKRGEAESVSAWVSDAMKTKLDNDARLRALAEVIADYEREFGEITEQDMRRVDQELKRRTIRTGGLRSAEPRKRYGR